MSLKETLRGASSRALVASGATVLGRALGDRDGALVLYGHRVGHGEIGFFPALRPERFDAQLAYLARTYEIISLETLLECFETGQPVPERSVVLTFDDGFYDNYEHALPILEKHRAPATVFVVTDSLETGDVPWPQRLGHLLQHAPEARLHDDLVGGEMPLATEAERRAVYGTLLETIKSFPLERRLAALDRLGVKLKTPRYEGGMIDWEIAREMTARGVSIGAHTVTHPWLARIPKAEARREMEGSRDAVRQRLSVDRPTFCFPGGSVNRDLLALVPELGFRSSFVKDRSIRFNRPGRVTPHTISRLGLPYAPAHHLEAEIDGPFHPLRQRLNALRGKPTGSALDE